MQGRTVPPVPKNPGYPVVGCSADMVKCAIIKMRVGSPSALTLFPLIWAQFLSRPSPAASLEDTL